MSSVVISGDTSGTITLQAPAVSGTTTLTLPATSGNFITDTGGVAPGTSGNLLTSNGTTWTSAAPPASGGFTTLVNNVTVGTGSSVTYSGLTLTSYKQLYMVFNGISNAAGTTYAIAWSSGGTNGIIVSTISTGPGYGFAIIDLISGAYISQSGNTASSPNGVLFSTAAGAGFAGLHGGTTITNSSTSITMYSGNTFTAGTITIYGVK
jgi:hypothetical protein